MKKSLVASLIVAPLLSLSSLVFAAEPAAHEPIQLTANQMDEVTAAGMPFGMPFPPMRSPWAMPMMRANPATAYSAASYPVVYKHAEVTQVNMSPVTIIQIGNNNTAVVYSGNFTSIYQ
ncbi:MAG TPA: hypothetical protein VM571_11205 [Noviherbaspirillum sp.]|nr:hypothetical protein [Noviherbaspirillum sp.]